MWLQRFDPGFIRTREAFKGALSLTLTIVLTIKMGTMPAVISGFVATTMALCHEGVTRRQQSLSMLLAWGSLVITLVIGNLLLPWPLLANGLLIIMVFIAFYLQQYGPRYRFFPLITAVVYLLVIHVHLAGTVNGYNILLACCIAGMISLTTQMLVGNGAEQLQVRHYHYVLQHQANAITQALANLKTTPHYTEHNVRAIKTDILAMHETIHETHQLISRIAVSKPHEQALLAWLEAHYTLYNALYMLWENILQMAKVKLAVVPERGQALRAALTAWQLGDTLTICSKKLEHVLFAKDTPVTCYFIYWSNTAYACNIMDRQRVQINMLLIQARQIKQESMS